MKGLILNDLKNTGITKLEYLIICLVFTALGLVIKLDTVYTIIIYLLIFSGPLLLIFNTKRESLYGWPKLEQILPIKQSKIVLSKYISYVIFMLLGSLIIALYSVGNFYTGVLVLDKAQVSSFLLVIGLFFNIGTFYFPIFLKLGADKADGILLFALVVSVLPLRLFMEISKIHLNVENVFYLQNTPAFYFLYVVGTFSLFIASYFASLRIYKNTEL